MKKNVLIVTRDLSYPGGTENFIKSMLIETSSQINYFLVETEGHANFEGESSYDGLIKAGVRILSPIGDDDHFWDINKAAAIQNIVSKYNINIVHSFLFNADFICCFAKVGSQRLFQEINGISSKLFFNLDKQAQLDPMDFTWFSSKFCDFSIALEKDTPEWIVRKEIIDNELEGLISKFTSNIFGVSNAIKSKWESLTNTVVEVIPCASIGKEELAIFEKDQTIHEGKNHPGKIYFTLSRLEPQKGVEDLIQAFKIHQKKFPLDVLKIAGDGSLRNVLEEMAGIESNIDFLGHLDRSNVLKLIAESDIFCLLSYSEGTPLSIQEAMAGKKIIIATNVGGVPDLIDNQVSGYLVEVGDVDGVVNIMNNISNSSSQDLIHICINASNKIKNYFLKEDAFMKYIKAYMNNTN